MRKTVTVVSAMLLVLGAAAGPALGGGHGQALQQQPDVCEEQHNNLRSRAEPIDLEPGDVAVHTADPSQDNFDEMFDFYSVHHGVGEFDELVYREPARLGPDNFCLGDGDWDTFWFGVSAPDEDGLQHEITHEGQVALYFETDEGWRSLKAQFDGKGELLHVNGVEPQ